MCGKMKVFEGVLSNIGDVSITAYKMAVISFEADASSCAFFAPDDPEGKAALEVMAISGDEKSLAVDFATRWHDEIAGAGTDEENYMSDDERRIAAEAIEMVCPSRQGTDAPAPGGLPSCGAASVKIEQEGA